MELIKDLLYAPVDDMEAFIRAYTLCSVKRLDGVLIVKVSGSNNNCESAIGRNGLDEAKPQNSKPD